MTSLTHYRPRTGMDLLSDDPFFRRLFGDWTNDVDEDARSWAPALDLIEHPTEYEVHVDTPGIDPKEIEVTLRDDVLVIRGERHGTTEHEDEKSKMLRRETWAGRFERAVRLPGGVDAAKVKARGKDGVLIITMPKAEQNVGRRITVQG